MKKKLQATVSLESLLQRRRTTLDLFLKEFCVNSYEDLVVWCDKLNVFAPNQQDVAKFFVQPPVPEERVQEIKQTIIKLAKKKVKFAKIEQVEDESASNELISQRVVD